MASILSKYVVLLEMQAARYQKELDSAQKKLARFEKQNKKSLDAVKAGFAAFGIGLGVREIGRFVGSIAEAGLKMERFQRSLKFATGSTQAAGKEFEFIRKVADELGLSLEDITDAYVQLAAAARGTNLEGQATRDIFTGVSQAARVLSLTSEQTRGALRAIEQMISKGNVQAEELRGQLGERLPAAFQTAARAMGVTTQELNDMLERGEVLAEELLPKLAKELTATFGPEVEEAASGAQAAFDRFSTSIFELKAAIAESGVMDLLTDLANLGTEVANGIRIVHNPSDLERIKQIREEIARLKKQQENFGGIGFHNLFGSADTQIAKLREEMLGLLQDVSNANNEIKRLSPIKPIAIVDAASADLDKVFEAQRKAAAEQEEAFQKSFQSFVRSYETAEQEVARKMAEFDVVAHLLPPDEQERIKRAIKQPLYEGIEEIEISAKRRVPAVIKEVEKVNDAAQELGLTFTSAFEDAIVEGKKLSDIFKGLLQDLARMLIRKTLLEPLIGGFSKLLPGKAAGGPVTAGVSYVVGEEGPEVFVPRASGQIIPNGAGGLTVNVNQTIQAGLPPQWQAQMMAGAQIAAAAAKQEMQKELGGRR